MNDLNMIITIGFKNREWLIWLNPSDELIALPTDEEPFDQDDLLGLENYLFNEGFFQGHYDRRMNKIDGSF